MSLGPKTIAVANKQKNYKLTRTATLLTKITSFETKQKTKKYHKLELIRSISVKTIHYTPQSLSDS